MAFIYDEVKAKYRDALRAEVNGFSETRVENGMDGSNPVNEMLEEWERIVNRVAKTEVGEKKIVEHATCTRGTTQQTVFEAPCTT